jgi:hypothetical protein
MNTFLRSWLSPVLKGMAVNKYDTSSSTRLIVQSRCGTLEYLSPLGVLMALQPYINSQRTIPVTRTPRLNEKQPNHSERQVGRTVAMLLNEKIPQDAKDALTGDDSVKLDPSCLPEALNSPSREISQIQSQAMGVVEKHRKKRTQFGPTRMPKGW